jgi:hypothetical protein
MCPKDYIELIVSIGAIIITAIVAIVSIKKTTLSSRASVTHNEMLATLIESVGLFRALIHMLGNVALGVVHVDDKKNVEEYAVDRYKRVVDDFVKKYEEVGPKIQLFLPVDLFTQHQTVLKQVNGVRSYIFDNNVHPQQNPNLSALRDMMDILNNEFFEYIQLARHYLGTDSLVGIGKDKPFVKELYGSKTSKRKED